jgi:hypothetical protein
MPSALPTWRLVLEVVQRLNRDQGDFRLQDVVHGVQGLDYSRDRGTIQPVVQGMTTNAGKGPPSPCGKPLMRVAHGRYRLVDESPAVHHLTQQPAASSSAAPRRPSVRLTSSSRDAELSRRIAAVVSDFGAYVAAYDHQVPFVRSGQYEWHRATINRRRTWPDVQSALNDDLLLDHLYETLQQWGIGRRASRLVPPIEFRERLRTVSREFAAFDSIRLDEAAAALGSTASRLWELIERLHVVKNASLIVPGTKTLHHLLPDLVPPMDRAWTGAFFLWSAAAPQSGQRRTFLRTFDRLAVIARSAEPSQYVGGGWRTSISKVVDNAIIGYCKIHGIRPVRG